jgi:hypothetical protein
MGHRTRARRRLHALTRIGCALWCVSLGCGDDADETQSSASGAREADGARAAIDGSVCREDADCRSGHCDNHVCCRQGECCLLAEDCSDAAAGLDCEDAAGCQGTRAMVTCEEYRCVAGATRQDDDSACGDFIAADPCGSYVAAMCDGSEDQAVPVCADSCADDSGCDKGASCIDGECLPSDQAGDCQSGGADGGAPCGGDCDTDDDCESDRRCRDGACEDKPGDGERCSNDGECASGHCDNGLCCQAGDCCNQPEECPSAYTVEATCSDPEHCQGASSEADCVDHVCLARVKEDDSACGADVVARTCGGSVIACLGTEDQSEPPPCAPGCSSDGDCPDDRVCRDGECRSDPSDPPAGLSDPPEVPDEPRLPDGEPCDAAAMCASGYCGNGYCCGGGFCCGSNADCAPLYVCSDASACDGTRLDTFCGGDSRCAVAPFASPVKDDSACLGRVVRDCGNYRAVVCGVGLSYEPPDCAWECSFNWDCSLGHICQESSCQ